jgi:hypothetical protein
MKTKTRIYLSILLIAVVAVPTSIVYAAYTQNTAHFRLEADAGWVDSGFDVQAGEEVTITAYGQSITAPQNFFGAGPVGGPDGQAVICPDFAGAPPCAMDGAPYGALVGKIGEDGEPFLIGSNYTFTATTSGDLYLAVNDLLPYYDDNSGNYMVFIDQ